jgi:hypothetical protein
LYADRQVFHGAKITKMEDCAALFSRLGKRSDGDEKARK